MFLNKLTLEEKEAFVSLAVKSAEANGVVTNEESALIAEYCREMGISSPDSENVKSMDEITMLYAESEEEHKKIIVLETIGLMNADGDFDDEEKEFVSALAEKIGVTKDTVNQMTDLISRYLDLTQEIIRAIGD